MSDGERRIDWDALGAAVALPGEAPSRVEWRKELVAGRSGARVLLVDVLPQGRPGQLAVLKVPPAGRRDDLERECLGEELVRSAWGPLVGSLVSLPTPRFLEPTGGPLVLGERSTPLLLSPFASSETTSAPCLAEELERCEARVRKHLRGVVHLYRQLEKAALANPQRRAHATGFEHFAHALGAPLADKLRSFDWARWGIAYEASHVVVGARRLVNPLCALTERAWASDRFLATRSVAHGDLNTGNVLPTGERLVLLDFEKAREAPLWIDPAFLLLWCLKVQVLDRATREDHRELLGFALKLGAGLRRGELPLEAGLGFHRPARVAARSLFELSSRAAQRSRGRTPEDERREQALSLGAMSLARAFYELRDAERGTQPEASLRNGHFYFALAAACLDGKGLCERSADASAFALELEEHRERRPSRRPQSEAELWYSVRSEVLGGGGPGVPAFHTKLLFTLELDGTARLAAQPWRKRLDVFSSGSDSDYFSGARLFEPGGLRDALEGLLEMAPVVEGAPRTPVLFEVDRSLLKNHLFLDVEGLRVELVGLDAVVMAGARRARVGLTFEGGACELEPYLRWLSSKSFASYPLRLRSGLGAKSKRQDATVGGLLHALKRSLVSGEAPTLEATRGHRGGWQPLVLHYALWPNAFGASGLAAARSDPARELAWKQLFARAPWSPQRPLEGEDAPYLWEQPMAEGALFALHQGHLGVLGDATLGFNRGQRPRVLRRAMYLQWLLAHESAGDPARREALGRNFTHPNRQRFWAECSGWLAKRYGKG